MDEIRERVLDIVRCNADHVIICDSIHGLSKSLVKLAFKNVRKWMVKSHEEHECGLYILNRYEEESNANRNREVYIYALSSFEKLHPVTLYEITQAKTKFACIKKWFIRSVGTGLVQNIIEHLFSKYIHYVDWIMNKQEINIQKEEVMNVNSVFKGFEVEKNSSYFNVNLYGSSLSIVFDKYSYKHDDLFRISYTQIELFVKYITNRGIDLRSVRDSAGRTIVEHWEENVKCESTLKNRMALYRYLVGKYQFLTNGGN